MIKEEKFDRPIKREEIMARDDLNISGVDRPVPQPAQRGRPSTKRPQILGIPKPWKCVRGDCQKSFSRKSDLNRHDNIHTNTRIHKCVHEGCGKTFIQTSALTVHRRIHTGEKPHVCPVCKRPFSDSSSLARHKRTHEKKKFPCSASGCGERFSDKAGLQKHFNRKHPSEVHSCAGKYGCSSGDSEQQRQKADVKSVTSGDADAMHEQNCLKMMEDVKIEETMKMEEARNTTPFGLQLATHANLPTVNGVYYSSQPPLSNMRTATTWQLGNTPQYSPRDCTPRAQRPHLPLVIPTVDGIYDTGPMSAPAFHSHTDAGSQSFPYMTSVMSQNYSQAYGNSPSAASSPMVQQVPLPSYRMVLSYRQRPPQMYRQRSHNPIETFGPSQMTTQSTGTPDTTIYSSPIESHYREPQDVGIINDTHHYQLPGTAFDMPDDDKMIDEFGEPFPSQVL